MRAVFLQRHRREVLPACKTAPAGPDRLRLSLPGVALKRLSVGKSGILPASGRGRRCNLVD